MNEWSGSEWIALDLFRIVNDVYNQMKENMMESGFSHVYYLLSK